MPFRFLTILEMSVTRLLSSVLQKKSQKCKKVSKMML